MPFSWLFSLVFEKRSRDTSRFAFHKISSGFESKQTLHLFTKQIKTYNNEPTKSTMSQLQSPQRRPMGSPRMAKALKFSLMYPDVPAYAALKIADYTDDEAQDRNRQKLLSKRRCRVERESSKENSRGAVARSRAWSVANPPVSSISIRSNTSTSSTSGITSNSEMNSPSRSLSRAPLTTAFVSTNGSSARSLSHPKQLSSKSRRTPKQKQSFEKEKRELFHLKNEAHVWALREIEESKRLANGRQLSVEEWARRASERFDFQVRGDTLRHMMRRGDTELQRPGPTCAIGDDAFATIQHAVLSKICLTQMNGDAELKENDLVSCIRNLGTRITSPRNLWRKLKAENAICLELSREVQVELRRQMWTTATNLGDWYDHFESFCIEYGFGDDGGGGKVVFTDDQKRRISNMDETKFSMDGSDGEIGGRPANSITIAGTTRSGTATNKASLSSTLMCGSTAAGEPLPIHAMFSSDAQEEKMVVDYRWIADFPRVQGRYGHDLVEEYCAQLTVNEKGGSDCRTLHQCLTAYQQRLWPDAADIPGKRVLYKIDGGPGRLDEGALADSRARGIYLFPGVQNTTQVTQETDQNYGQFKSDVRSNIAALTADLVREYSRQLAHHQADPTNCRAPSKMPQLGREHYGIILSGRDANQAKGFSSLRPAFHNAFCQTKNLAAWAKVGAVPMTRQAMRHVSVRSEVMREDNCILVEEFDPFCIFDYKSATMLDVEQQNKIVCAHLNSMGYNADSFVVKARRKAHNLVQRLSRQTSEEERVIALAKSGISLSSIFFVVGPSCLSTDEIFKAIEYKKKLELWETACKERDKIKSEEKLHEKGIQAMGKETKKKRHYEDVLRWKMGAAAYNKDAKGKRIADLLLLFENYKDVVVAPLVVPEEMNKPPPLPHISETALGQASTKFVKEAVLPNIKNMGREAILELRQELDNALTTNKEN
jgi:hypothetical protein